MAAADDIGVLLFILLPLLLSAFVVSELLDDIGLVADDTSDSFWSEVQ